MVFTESLSVGIDVGYDSINREVEHFRFLSEFATFLVLLESDKRKQDQQCRSDGT